MSKTVVVNYFGKRGSGPEYAFEMTRGLVENGCRVYAVLSSRIDNLSRWRELSLEGIITVDLSDHYKGILGSLWRFFTRDLKKIRRYFEGKAVDMLYIPMVHPLSIPILRMFKRMNVETVFTLHDVWPHKGEENLYYLPIRRSASWLARHADRVGLLSESFREYVKSRYCRHDEDIVIIPHGVFSAYSERMRTVATRSEAPAPLAEFNFLFFGRIVSYKGLDLLAGAWKRLSAEFGSRVSLRIAGSGDFSDYRQAFDECAVKPVVDNRFITEEELIQYFRMPHTITVLPYIEASQSGVIPLAMSEDSLIIITRNSGLIEQTCGGELALVAEKNVDSLYLTMKKAVTDYEKQKAVIAKAHEYIDSLQWDKIASKLL